MFNISNHSATTRCYLIGYASLGASFVVACEAAKIAIRHFSGLNFGETNRMVALSCFGASVISLLLLDLALFNMHRGWLSNHGAEPPPLSVYSWRSFPLSLHL